MRSGDGFEARRVANERERGEVLHRQWTAGAFERFTQVVNTQ